MKLELFSTEFQKTLKHQISWKSVHWKPSCTMRTGRRKDGRMDIHDEANSRSSQFGKCD